MDVSRRHDRCESSQQSDRLTAGTVRNAAAVYNSFSALRVNAEAGIVFVTIDHPAINLLDAELMIDLDRFAGMVATDESVRVVVFQSADSDFFIAHGDMNFITDPASLSRVHAGGRNDSSLNPMQRLHERIRLLPQVTIGKISDPARGGGAEVLEALDMRFAARDLAGLALNEVSTGIIPGAGATTYLPRFDADMAERYGWVNRALPADALDGFVCELARHIADLQPGVIAAAKTAVHAAEGPIVEALRIQNKQLGALGSAPIAAELNRAALKAGAQTRQGERDSESILQKLRS